MAPNSSHHHLHLVACLLILALRTTPAMSGRHHRHLLPNTRPDVTDQYLDPQNQARAAVGVSPLRWGPDLAVAATTIVSAQQQQKGCQFADVSSSPYGANQGWASYPASPGEVVGAWVAQGKYYNHANNTCASGQQCGTYTQVVWRRTAEVGCAQATCANGATLTLCLYNPHGNVQGQSPY